MIESFPYSGGKYFQARSICQQIPEHHLYGEPFFGSGRVFFAKKPSRVEVINDQDAEVVTFFRVCQHHHEELLRCLRFSIISRKCYDDLLTTRPESLTDILRACRFLYLQRLGYGGLVQGRHYVHRRDKAPQFKTDKLPELINAIHRRFNGVQVECGSYEQILSVFDHPSAFFYLDPPYFGAPVYRFNFEHEDFVNMARKLARLQGLFILSLNDVSEVRAIFSQFHFQQLQSYWPTKTTNQRRASEVLISNFKLGLTQ